jgi:prolyl-tRNA synthetase
MIEGRLGIYTLCRSAVVTRKVEQIVREEMNRAGAPGCSCPCSSLPNYGRAGRWDVYGEELMRLKDRSREFVLRPTHEEVITDLVRTSFIPPVTADALQIQTKFRDEVRP